jgi:hypothetical protein
MFTFHVHKHTKQNRQDIDMVSTIAVRKQNKANLEMVINHAKNDLFKKAKFIHEPKVDLALEGKICSDCQKSAKI